MCTPFFREMNRIVAAKMNTCCMAHARAKFHAALDQGKDQRAEHIIYLIGQLYHLESEIKNKSIQEIYQARNSERARQIKEKLIGQVTKLLTEEVGQSDTLMGKAIRYFKKFKTQLFAYMKDGRYTIDNLIAERAIRSFTVERNNAPTFCSHNRGLCPIPYGDRNLQTPRIFGIGVPGGLLYCRD